jgi:hypothetical protein
MSQTVMSTTIPRTAIAIEQSRPLRRLAYAAALAHDEVHPLRA